MDRATVNRRLYRPIKSGMEIDSLFPKSQCEQIDAGTGDTYLTISNMKKTVYKYAHHVKKIAPQLASNTLQATINNIHQFLYNHIQYKIDGYEQYLKSPGCTWATRSTGADCKSYSIFASAILLNLGITHYLRKVRQKNLNPDYWTHVYVVVPTDQKTGNLKQGYHLIDATLKNNREVSYLEKKDVIMNPQLPNYILASPAISECNCHVPEYTGQLAISLGQAAYNDIVEGASKKLNDFLTDLARYSKSGYALKQLQALIKEKIAAGRDPIIKITTTGVYVDNQFVNLKETLTNLRNNTAQSLGATTGATTGSTTNFFTSTASSISPYTGLISSLLPANFVQNTFGAIFANGFDLSCWNSSFSPSKSQQEMAQYHTIHFQKLENAINGASNASERQTAINLFIRDAYIMYAHYADPSFGLLNSNNWSKCSIKGIKAFVDFQKKIKDKADELITQLKAQGATVTNIQVSPVKLTIDGKEFGATRPATYKLNVPQIKLNNIAPAYTPVPANEQPVQEAGFGSKGLLFAIVVATVIAVGSKISNNNHKKTKQ